MKGCQRNFGGLSFLRIVSYVALWFTGKVKEQFLRIPFLWPILQETKHELGPLEKFPSAKKVAKCPSLAHFPLATITWPLCLDKDVSPVKQNKRPFPIVGDDSGRPHHCRTRRPTDTRHRRTRWPPHHRCTRRHEAVPIAHHRLVVSKRRPEGRMRAMSLEPSRFHLCYVPFKFFIQ